MTGNFYKSCNMLNISVRLMSIPEGQGRTEHTSNEILTHVKTIT